METKANFVLIGTLTLAGVIGAFAMFLWFAKVEIDQEIAEYDVLFTSVAGLSLAGDVRFQGLLVGQVAAMEIDQEDPSLVRVRIEIDAETPIKTDTVGVLNAQGVTGVSYVSLEGGSPETPFLRDVTPEGQVPEIFAEQGTLQSLTEDVPRLVNEAIGAVRDLRSLLSDENRATVGNILVNLEDASLKLDQALIDFSDISTSVREGADQISRFTGRLEGIGDAVEQTLEASNVTLGKIETTMQSATTAFDAATETIGHVDEIVQTRVPEIADDLTAAIRSIETTSNELRPQVATTLGKFNDTADAATARLNELENTIIEFELTMDEARDAFNTVETSADAFEILVEGEGAALVADSRALLADVKISVDGINAMIANDVPVIVENVREAVTTANRVIDQVGQDITEFTASLDPLVTTGEEALKAATLTLSNADRTLSNIDRALETAEGALQSVERTFDNADSVITEDLGPAIADVRSAAGQFEETMATLSADIPAVTADLREAMARALDVIKRIDTTVQRSAPGIETFTTTGLPEFTQFARQAQQLVSSLDQLTRRLERDPARFFFGNDISEFRR